MGGKALHSPFLTQADIPLRKDPEVLELLMHHGHEEEIRVTANDGHAVTETGLMKRVEQSLQNLDLTFSLQQVGLAFCFGSKYATSNVFALNS